MLYIGLDVGTTGTKAIVVDGKGSILSKGYCEYELSFPQSGWVEQNAEDWWTATVKAVRQATSKLDDCSPIKGIGLSTQGATMLPVDCEGNPLSPAITWMDNRAKAQAEVLANAIGGNAIYHKSGWQVGAAYDAAKVLWIKQEQPELFQKTAYFISTLEFMNHRLCGRFVIDPTNASIRQMLNIHTGQWDEEILNAIGIATDRLPQVQPAGSLVGTLTPKAAEELGLPASVQVFNGAHDQYCAALGSGAVNAGDMLLATGTTWVVLGVTNAPLYTKSFISPGIFPTTGQYGAMASLVSAGSALKWYHKIIGDDFIAIDEGAEKSAESAADLLFYPYLCGAGFPHGKAEARGALLGLDLHHNKYDIARALMEGVAFETALVLEEFAQNGMEVRRLMMTGGASKSQLWSSLVGYITGCQLFRMQEPDTACMGAAMMACVGVGEISDYTVAAAEMLHPVPLVLNDQTMFDFYREKKERYRANMKSNPTFS